MSCRSCGTSTGLSHTSVRRSTSSTVSPTSTASVSSGWVRNFASAPRTWPPGLNHRWSMPPLWTRPCGGVVRAIGTGPHEPPAWCAPARVAERDSDVGSAVVRLVRQATHGQFRYRFRSRGLPPRTPPRAPLWRYRRPKWRQDHRGRMVGSVVGHAPGVVQHQGEGAVHLDLPDRAPVWGGASR